MSRFIRVLCCVMALCLMCGCSAVMPSDSSSMLPDDSSSASSAGFFETLGSIVGTIINTEETIITEVEQTEVEIKNNKSKSASVYESPSDEAAVYPEQDVVLRSDIMCYSKLNDIQKRIYRTLLTVSERMVEGWINLGKCGDNFENNVSVAYRALTSDHPEIFWMPNTYLLSKQGFGSNPDVIIAFSLDDEDNSCEYIVSKSQRDIMRDELDAAVGEAESCIQSLIYGFDIELALHDFICERAVYDETSDNPLIYTSYGALVLGSAVCEGYSRAMQLLCDMAGIPCAIIYGEADGIGHMWNLINPGDAWYHLDLTWDDTEMLVHSYFNLKDEEILRDHIIYEPYSEDSLKSVSDYHEYNLISFECISTYSNYFHINGYILDEDYSIAAACINLAAREGKNYIQMRVDSEKTLSEFNTNYEVCAVKVQRSLNRILGNEAEINGISVSGNIVTFFW